MTITLWAQRVRKPVLLAEEYYFSHDRCVRDDFRVNTNCWYPLQEKLSIVKAMPLICAAFMELFFFLSLWEVVSNCSNNSDMLYMDPSWKPSQDLKGYRELSWSGLWCKNLFSLSFHMKYRLIWKENITVNQKSHAVFSLASLNWFPIPLNPFLLGISMHIFHTVFYTFPKVLMRRIWFIIHSFSSW